MGTACLHEAFEKIFLGSCLAVWIVILWTVSQTFSFGDIFNPSKTASALGVQDELLSSRDEYSFFFSTYSNTFSSIHFTVQLEL